MNANPRQVTRRKKSVDVFALLSDDLLLEIFKNLPPNQLRFKIRFVCRRWFNIITNSILLDHASIILEKPATSHSVRLIDIREEKQALKTKKENIFIGYSGRIKSWCNEYLLITDKKKAGSLYMFNLITKRRSLLPQCSISCGGHHGHTCGVGLSYDKSKGLYKIIHVFVGPPVQSELLVIKSKNIRYECSEWRKVNGPCYTGQRQYLWDDPVSVQGRYLHWDVHCPKYLLSMDTVEERFRQTCLPESDVYSMKNGYCMVEMGGFLALLHKIPVDQVNIWMLKDFERAKWEKFFSISGSSSVCPCIYPGSESDILFPVTSVRSKRYIIFRKNGRKTGLYSYDLKNKILKRLRIDFEGNERCVVHSTTSGFW